MSVPPENPLAAPLAPWLQQQLRRLLAQRGHALLLSGPSGLGQYELALALARTWLCENPSEQGPCGHCGSCHAIDVRTHADLCVLMPETLSLELGWPLDEGAQKEIDDKKRKASKLIRVEAAREAVSFTQLTRSRGSIKAVLVYPAERMNVESANTLLKTLEEPVGEVRFVLATEAAHQLLPTIRSRCQGHAMVWPATDEALKWLQVQASALGRPGAEVATREQAQVWLQAAGGRPADALDWARSGLNAQTWTQLPQALARGDWTPLADWPAARQLAVLQKLCHDLMATASGAVPRFFPANTLPKAPRWAVLATWSRELMGAARTVEHPFNAGLMQEAWAARTHQVLGTGGGATGR
ncbi:MAG: DNA polymerase III subunit delta' [Hydrogenophaga sp.]|uniref:DNA polymerase III subunit delta' n=1 Tax=Hydrogenophaga sp. TaxID=1904254 RepID=UPI001BC2A6A6|nr:DNA polymerase III subunit delta' [Hydrogenophaga sp.]MBS3911312.1 DNA polymerase III subunit delta' [Hydrogenophaga sp.]MDO9146131.1 DNA polymerase III subunit delta' [Hydrogenophaga sp.]MDO9605590.1 DNA polymerase III subunit delta' [Hydrogenophaga sp.]MDP2166258.1 DNA polymerase III subunit delta' [Hydrogenophaga sp.]MDP2166277.1 DNA polymerase III subunit delta' [Hydrogenophaga sp.]